jgi:maltooligosyltrehalose trehalohydrolase
MKRRHDMPFGAECRPDGSVRFGLWAPAASRVDLCFGNGSEPDETPLEPRDKGWFQLITDAAKPGTQYSFRINGVQKVPDPASRFQPQDVHGPSEVINPEAFDWQDETWRGRRWEEAVLYEMHVGAFSEQGTFSGVRDRLDDLVDLGITAIEIMPVADFPGKRNWGYDGVFPFAPDSTYGRPEDLKELVQSAHRRGLMVLLDVVYNHFGPEGNYLNSYAPQFFTDRHKTPWGNGINFDGRDSRPVRDFFINNALYWLTEYHFDGLRLDAVHAIIDDSAPDILTELSEAVRSSIEPDRKVHLILENEGNQSRYLERAHGGTAALGCTAVQSTVMLSRQSRTLRSLAPLGEPRTAVPTLGQERCQPRAYTAQWNDDIHHALHVLITGEHDGYYIDYSDHPLAQLGRCLTEGFAYQGEASGHKNGQTRGEPTNGLPPTAFVSFLQNHDQIGNRALGERITKLADPRAIRAAVAILLLAPSPPLLFMGEEFAAETPFLFFCDFEKDLAAAVTEGRRNEFAQFARFNNPDQREHIPDPNSASTYRASRLNWSVVDRPSHQEWLCLYRELLRLRAKHIVPRLADSCRLKADYKTHGDHGLTAHWTFPDESNLTLLANLGTTSLSGPTLSSSNIIYASQEGSAETLKQGVLPPWSVVWLLES